MKTRHATDMEIQKFIFDQSECASHTIEHIRSCEECNESVKSYLSLSSIIKEQPEPTLEYNLSKLVLDQLPPIKEPETSHNYLINFIVISLGGLIFLSLFLFKETTIYLLDNRLIQQTYFIISIILFISSIVVFDLFKSFTKKVEFLNNL